MCPEQHSKPAGLLHTLWPTTATVSFGAQETSKLKSRKSLIEKLNQISAKILFKDFFPHYLPLQEHLSTELENSHKLYTPIHRWNIIHFS